MDTPAYKSYTKEFDEDRFSHQIGIVADEDTDTVWIWDRWRGQSKYIMIDRDTATAVGVALISAVAATERG